MAAQEDSDAERFGLMFDVCAPRVLAYVRRHVERDAVEEIVSDAFVTAWRRLPDVPDPALPWLLVVARNTIANHYRRLARDDRILVELAALQRVVPNTPGVEDVVVSRATMLAALKSLTALERDALLLTAWDGLSDIDAAEVLGCSPRAFRVRLHRARKRLDRAMASRSERREDDPDPPIVALDLLLKEAP